MKTKNLLRLVTGLLGLSTLPLGAAPFDSGSNASLGDLVVSESVTIALPPDGVLNYQRFEVKGGGVVHFQKNELNTPVTLLAKGEVIIAGLVLLDGTGPSGADPGRGGPGGFDGGRHAQAGLPAGAGKGPGGGLPGPGGSTGPGAFASRGDTGGDRSTTAGLTYGDPLLLPIVGGSGGGGSESDPVGGGGGGGAILIASNVRVSVLGGGGIYARGAENSGSYNDGAGGGIRLVGPVIDGTGVLSVVSGPEGGVGRIRLDSLDSSQARFSIGGSFSSGALLLTKLPQEPKLNVVKIGDRDVPPDSTAPVSVIFPSGAPAERIVKVQARDFNTMVPIRLALIPEHGTRVFVDAEINNTAPGVASFDLPVTFPLNVVVTVSAWTR